MAIDNETGGIRAIVGGRNWKARSVLLAKRQAGSTFKPFVYAAAFSKGMAPEHWSMIRQSARETLQAWSRHGRHETQTARTKACSPRRSASSDHAIP